MEDLSILCFQPGASFANEPCLTQRLGNHVTGVLSTNKSSVEV